MLQKSTFQLLRFHFSLFLLPVYLFALTQVQRVNTPKALLIFFILHILVYPSSNGYNSYMDRDEGPIGGLSRPLQPTRELFYLSVIMDILGIGLGFLISPLFAFGVLAYILASRAYSYRGIRLKKYPVTGYLVVILFQGAGIFILTWLGCQDSAPVLPPLAPVIAAACLIGGYYPLTQVYQHEADIEDGVRTISYLLGKKGTFAFCGIVFMSATISMFITFRDQHHRDYFVWFFLCMLPMVWFFSQWAVKVWKNEEAANFKNSLIMNILASGCTSLCFLGIIIQQSF